MQDLKILGSTLIGAAIGKYIEKIQNVHKGDRRYRLKKPKYLRNI